jgi:hypothetical protein
VKAQTLRPGDVVRYEPESRWCHDGYAIAQHHGNLAGELVLVDTYWSGSGGLVRPESYEVLFNLADYEEVPVGKWETYASADREYIPVHSGYRTRHLVRKGATPDLSTQIENARERVSDAEQQVRSAQWSLDYARNELAALEAQVLP